MRGRPLLAITHCHTTAAIMFLMFSYSIILLAFLPKCCCWSRSSGVRQLGTDTATEPRQEIFEELPTSARKSTLNLASSNYFLVDDFQKLTVRNKSEIFFPPNNSFYIARPFRGGTLTETKPEKKRQEITHELKNVKKGEKEEEKVNDKENGGGEEEGEEGEEGPLLSLDEDMVFSEPDGKVRRRRSAKPKTPRTFLAASIELCVIVDYKLYKIFLERTALDHKRTIGDIKRYFAATVAMMNERFKGINEPNLSIKIMFSNILIAQSVMESFWTERHRQIVNNEEVINATKVMTSLTKWVSADRLGKYDHIILFTGYSMVNSNGDILKGLAFVGEICHQKRSVSLVNDIGNFQSAGVAAHELGHSLGAHHDGVEENRDCSSLHNYIMSPNEYNDEQTRHNYMYLSKCSIRQIKNVLGSGSAECVFDKPRSIYVYDLKKYPPGRSYSANEQCKMIYGQKSGTCNQTRLLDKMCFILWCRDPIQTETCRAMGGVRAAPGTKCDIDKMCWRGSCIEEFRRKKPRCLPKTRSCKGRDKNRQYCSRLIKLNPYACQRGEVIKYCCQTCKRCHKRHSRRRRRVRRRRTKAQAISS